MKFMTTFLFTHPVCLLHDNGPAHPECPERLSAILAELDKPEFAALERRAAPVADKAAIARVHAPAYIDMVLDMVPREGRVMFDEETSLTPESGEAALRAAGAVVAAVDAVMATPNSNAFCAVRPPGHHAATPPASGFCLFNNVAIGAAHACAAHGLKRVAIVDFDVHHGNGTQAWVEGQDGVLFVSSHQFPLWPGSGRASDHGPHGNIVNIPLPPGAGGDVFRAAMQAKALPALEAFRPEMIFISAGFDAHRADPLGGLRLVEDDYNWITAKLVEQAKAMCGGRIISTLEGGYNIEALARSAAAHMRGLMETK
jgi:acetoin utilization deacetylase AcuC-like enzyme